MKFLADLGLFTIRILLLAAAGVLFTRGVLGVVYFGGTKLDVFAVLLAAAMIEIYLRLAEEVR